MAKRMLYCKAMYTGTLHNGAQIGGSIANFAISRMITSKERSHYAVSMQSFCATYVVIRILGDDFDFEPFRDSQNAI